MEQILQIVAVSFTGINIFLICVLSFSWIFIYGIFLVVMRIAPLVFIKLPTYFMMWFLKRKEGVNLIRLSINNCQIPDQSIIENERTCLANRINTLDKRLSAMAEGKFQMHRTLFDYELRKKFTNSLMNNLGFYLEKDYAYLSAFSTENEIVQSGLLSFIENPKTEYLEKIVLLFLVATFRDKYAAELAEHHLYALVDTPDGLSKISIIANKCPYEYRLRAHQIIQLVDLKLKERRSQALAIGL